jgi:uncharacterized ferritin-like protein (DUF455 family)
MNSIGTMVVRGGVVLRSSPAREPYFRVVTDQTQMDHFEDGTLEARREHLHGDVNNEIQSLEIAAQSLVDFPDTPWDLRMELARQCWDEVRHARLFRRRLLALGGHLGQFPILNQEWGVSCMFDSMPARLAVQNRTFEALSLDIFKEGVEAWATWGDHETSEIMDGVMVDEIRHAAFAHEWLTRLTADNPAVMLNAVSALSKLRAMTAALTPPGHKMAHDIPVNAEDRRHAGLST